jgi:hypothetical protein
MDLADIVAHFAALGRGLEALGDALGGGGIMHAEALGIDELGFVDDPVDLLVRPRELDERQQAACSAAIWPGAPFSAGATCSRTCSDMSRTSARNTASFESK